MILFRLFVLLLLAFSLYRILRGCDLHPLAAVLFVFLASLALRFRFYIRPELLSFLLLLVSAALLSRLRGARPGTAYGLLPVQFIWANVHASSVFGFALPGRVLLANLLPKGRAAPGWGHLSLDRLRLRHLATAVACLPLAALVNPHGVSMLLFPLWQNTMVGLVTFAEWAGVWVLPQIDPVW